jgi:L-2-hydroxyglutarate oxidase LhgO
MIDAVVVGGGAIGCAIARELTVRKKQVVLIEKLARCGMETSSRSSEVFHRGIYYPKSSLKSSFCISGRELLLNYMESRNINYKLCGKLIVAPKQSQSKHTALKSLYDFGLSLGMTDLRWLSADDTRILEPSVECSAAIWSPLSGIFDSQAVIASMVNDIESSPTFSSVVPNCEFLSAKPLTGQKGFLVQTSHGPLETTNLIIATGLFATDSTSAIENFPLHIIPKAKYAKGYYFKLRVRDAVQPFHHLVYPLPENGGLGIHSTLNLAGEVRFGPNVEWLNRQSQSRFPDYSFPAETDSLENTFRSSIAQYWPPVNDTSRYSLVPDYSGIRTKIDAKTPDQYPDFTILNKSDHGMKGLICLFGMESPGWTSSLAIAVHVANLTSTYH